MSDEGIRLAKRVADLVPCSRAEAERYIAGGWVSVDGVVVEEPAARVTDAQAIDMLPGAEASDPAPVTILLHKPAGLDAAAALALVGPDNRVATMPGERFLKRHLAKLTITTPLENEASGLLVLTQDWRVTRKLVDDSNRIEQEYVAEVNGAIGAEGLARLNGSMRLNGRPTTPLKASWQSEARLRMAGKDLRLGQVTAMCTEVGLTVTTLRRLRVGRIALGAVPVGQWRYLRETERF